MTPSSNTPSSNTPSSNTPSLNSLPADRHAPVLTDPRVRPITPSDVARTVELIFELAVYERLPDECHITAEQLRTALFGPAPALFGLAGFDNARARQVGYALYFLNFSTWEGVHGIYLEDLYVTPECRGSGLGKAMLTTLAATAVDRGYARVEWSVLDWNEPSIDFYRSLGATSMDGWTTFRLSGDDLRRTAPSRTEQGTA